MGQVLSNVLRRKTTASPEEFLQTQSEYYYSSCIDSSITTTSISDPSPDLSNLIGGDSTSDTTPIGLRLLLHDRIGLHQNILSAPRSVLGYYSHRDSTTVVDTVLVQQDITLFSSSSTSEESRGKEEGIEDESYQVLSNVLRCVCICGEAEDESYQNPIEIFSLHPLLNISPPLIQPSKTITTRPEEFRQTHPSDYCYSSCIDSSITTPPVSDPSSPLPNLIPVSDPSSPDLSTSNTTTGLRQHLLPTPRSILDYYSQTDSTIVEDTITVQNDTLFSSSSNSEEKIIRYGDKNLKEPRGKEEGIEEEEKLIICINEAVPVPVPVPVPAVMEENRWMKHYDSYQKKLLVSEVPVVIEEIRWIKHYNSCQKILLVGEGDFSFSASLAMAFGNARNIIATSLNSTGYLSNTYRSAMSNIQSLRGRGAKVMHEVDATKMANQILFQGMTFDRIVFNFPLSGFFPDESRESKLRRERKLVRLFIANAREMITERGEIHVTHKSNAFFLEWKLEEMASSEGLQLIDEVHFNYTDFPGYRTKYGFGTDKNFNCNPSKTYKFGL
ncbi:hypothetical protein Vadar_014337 [Vaccinium darrowii]|uniref:Uncharacterized protein n=1 Tax=Vaccinium darrowii TaxID=229202 RepID=A0ACB7Z3S8_9ERIC|nr:hypothetical protein Vadar_014337 [Vaccinium darrowii]